MYRPSFLKKYFYSFWFTMSLALGLVSRLQVLCLSETTLHTAKHYSGYNNIVEAIVPQSKPY
jgi:hypothetical protein